MLAITWTSFRTIATSWAGLALLAAIFLGERLGGLEAVGGLMVLSAAILVNLPPVRLGRQSEATGSGPKADHSM